MAEIESFHKFFECWLVEQSQHMEELVLALREHEQQLARAQEELDSRILLPKIARVLEHYEHYYRAKSRWAASHVASMLSMFKPSWRSSLEDALMWIGGWRPTMAFRLLYSKSGQARFGERGLTTGGSSELNPTQLDQVNELHSIVIREERKITEELAKIQETVADSSMVELSHAVSESMRDGGQANADADEGLVEAALAPKEEGLGEVMQMADGLRLKTLKGVVDILSPKQGAHFLIAAAELHLRLHEWGRIRDARHHRVPRFSRQN